MRAIVLPSWMYGDPADVAERLEIGERRALARPKEQDPIQAAAPRPRCELLSPGTMRLVNRARIRELMRKARP